jgi:hypothetical protein
VIAFMGSVVFIHLSKSRTYADVYTGKK